MGDEAVVERLADVLPIVGSRRLVVDLAHLGPHQAQAPALQAPEDLAYQAALDGVGLAYDQGPLSVSGFGPGIGCVG
jgi:hypothetical protein